MFVRTEYNLKGMKLMYRNLILVTAALTATLPLLPGQTNEPTRPTGPPQPESALQVLEQQWADAVKRRDIDTIDRIQAEEYIFTDPAGQVWMKTRELAALKSGDLQVAAFEMSDVKVRIYDDAAVVTLRIVWHGTFRGLDISGPQRMTDVFLKRDGRWQCVASQSTRIPTS